MVGGVVCDGRDVDVSVCGSRVVRQRLVVGQVRGGCKTDESEDGRVQLWSIVVDLLREGGEVLRPRLWTGSW